MATQREEVGLRLRLRVAFTGVVLLASLLAGCGGGGTSTLIPNPTATATPTTSPSTLPSGATPTPTPTGATPTPTSSAATPTPTAMPTPTPTPTGPTPTPTPLVLSTGLTSITSVAMIRTFTASEAGYTGALNAESTGSTSCTGIATFTPVSANGPSATFTVTGVAAGQCAIVVSDTNGQSMNEAVAVTTTGGTIQGRRRR